MHACQFCGVTFKHISSKSRHENHTCKVRNKQLVEKKIRESVISEMPSNTLVKQDNVALNHELNNNLSKVKINYVLPRQNYWEMLKEKKGTPGALRFLHRCADLKLGGDVLMFEELFLPQDNKESWPVARKEGSKRELILKEPDGSVIDECAARVIYDRFADNYKDALLQGSNQILSLLIETEEFEQEVIKENVKETRIEVRGKEKKIDPEELEHTYVRIFTEYDFGLFQDRAFHVEHEHPKPHSRFAFGVLESSFK